MGTDSEKRVFKSETEKDKDIDYFLAAPYSLDNSCA